MLRYFKILTLLIISHSHIFSQDIEIIEYSGIFTIDTIPPEIEIFTPEHGDQYNEGDIINITWASNDDSPKENPMTLNVSGFIDTPYMELATNFANSGHYGVIAPDLHTIFASLRLDVVDYYGNISSDYTDGYFTIGDASSDDYSVVEETFYQENTSSEFTIDTNPPIVTWIYPNDAASFYPNQAVILRWEAEDENLHSSPISLYFSIGSEDLTYTLYENIDNTGFQFSYLPDVNTQLGQFYATAIDYYGNVGQDGSDSYISVGEDNYSEIEDTTATDTAYSTIFTIDTKPPQFMPMGVDENGDDFYFYPNGNEILSDYSNVELEFTAIDESSNNASVSVSMAYLLGGWYIPVTEDIPIDNSAFSADLSVNGLIEPSIWARLLFTAKDDYGNEFSKYNNDYFILGTSEGDISLNWFDEEEGQVMVNWSWDGTRRHSIGIRARAYSNHLNVGDKITVIDLNGQTTNDCDTEFGYIELAEFTISDSDSLRRTRNIFEALNHCDQGGQIRPGYNRNNTIYFKITHSANDSSYIVLPDTLNGANTFDNSHTLIRSFDFASPIQLESQDDEISTNTLENIERDFDSFGVYNKIGSIQLRDCDNPGTGENEGWCFDEIINDQTSYVAQLPTMQQSSNVKYRVWLLDNNGNEIFKTLDTEGLDYYVDLSDIYDRSLESGWNWFSLNLSNEDMSLNNILASIDTNAVYIKGQQGYADYYDDFGWYGTFDYFDNLSSYKIDVTHETNITYQGTLVDITTPIPIFSGWNWISYLPGSSLAINTALEYIGSSSTYIKSQLGYADYYDDFGWYGTIDTMDPRQGYIMFSGSDSTLIYPDEESVLSRTINHNELYEDYWSYNFRDYQHSGSITLSTDNIESNLNDQIGAFYNNECRGVAHAKKSPFNNKIIFQLMFYSNNENEKITFRYFDSSKNEIYDIEEEIIFIPDMFLNDALNPYYLNRVMPYIFALNNPYPNPFNPVTVIDYSIKHDVNDLSIKIYDITGRLVETLFNGYQVYGNHKLRWNASSFSSGIYFIKMDTKNHTFTKKIILLK